MLQTIGAAIFVTAVFGTKPIAKAIGKVADTISAKKEEKRAYKEAMDKYMQMHALDIEH